MANIQVILAAIEEKVEEISTESEENVASDEE